MYRLLIILGLAWQAVAVPLGEKQVDMNGTSYGEQGPYYEGDIILNEAQRQGLLGKQGLTPDYFRWPGKTVYYSLLPLTFSAAEVENIKAGIKMITSTTCIKILPRTTQRGYILMDKSGGCNSELGFQDRVQSMSVVDCKPGSIAHELLHAIGIAHEQARDDRDDYVTINYQNIVPGNERNFEKRNDKYWSLFGTKYDYGSIMHYGETYFSKDGQPTIVPKQKGVTIGQRNGLSQKDIQLVKTMYNC